MQIFVFGSDGMLGNYMQSYLRNTISSKIVAITRKDYDLADLTISSLRAFLSNKKLEKDDIVINCAGLIPQALKNERRLYFLINSVFPIILSMICKELDVKMIHITTDCVFSGKDNGFKYENSVHDETNDYGISKSLGEVSDATIIRTSIIGEERNNKRSLLEWVRSNQGKTINGYINHYWNGVTCLQLAKIIKDIIEKNLFWNGVRHIFSPTSVSKYELVSMINEIYDLNINILKFPTDINIDKTIKSIFEMNFEIPELREQIIEMKKYKFD